MKVNVGIDSREDDGVLTDLISLLDVHEDVKTWYVAELPAADLDVNGIGFERKTLEDYISSLLENRLREQAIKLNQCYDHAYVLLEANLEDTQNPFEYSSISEEAVRGSMASLTARQGIPVIPVGNRSLLADMAVRIARKHLEEAGVDYLPKGSVSGSNEPAGKMMWGTLNGIGPERAEALYDRFGSPIAFLESHQYPIDALSEVDGIGEKTAQQIVEEFDNL